MRAKAVLVVLAVVVLAGCSLPAFVGDEPTATSDPEAAPGPAANGTLADPAEDVKGWENGVWYNESLPVDASDGLNETELAMVVNRSMARVEYVRNVEFDRPVTVSVISREEYADRNGGGGGGDGEKTPGQREEAARLEALFLVGETTDAQDEKDETRSATVQGFYSPSKDEITIVAPTDTPQVDEITLAHELVHAYQFRGHLDVRFPQNPTRDERRALVSLIEGDANVVDGLVADRCGTEWDCIDDTANDDGSGDGTGDGTSTTTTTAEPAAPRPNMGLYILSYFPYAEGEEYVRAVKADGGWSAVNDLYRDPPGSTEHVIHRDGESHGEVAITDRSESDWSRVGPTSNAGLVDGVVMGEADVATMFAATLYDDRDGAIVTRDEFLQDGPVPIDYGLPPSDGWAGDRFYAYESDGGDTGYVWRLAFDTTDDASEFASAYRDLLTYHNATSEGDGVYVVPDGAYADAFRVTRDGDTVTIVNAPTTGDLDDVHDPAASQVLASLLAPHTSTGNRTSGSQAGTQPASPSRASA